MFLKLRNIAISISKLILLALLILAIFVAALYIYAGPFTAWDAKTCVHQVGSKFGIEPTFPAIYSYIDTYIQGNLYLGMPRDEALAKLQKLGPMNVGFDTISISNTRKFRDIIELTYCHSPINYIGILIFYDSNKQITYFDFIRD